MQHRTVPDLVDVFVIGGGINGCGIARDAAGRGLSVILAEQGDLAQGTSSASTKLFHGGLRYLEYFEFRLVREALQERETLLAAMPHISWPMRFVLPLNPKMRFASDTPASRLLTRLMPWMKGRRPAWMIRLALGLYDGLGGRQILAPTRVLDLRKDVAGRALRPEFTKAFEYSDCWVQDSRLVVLNARDAAQRGAHIFTRTRVVAATPEDGHWRIETSGPDGRSLYRARSLVNAGGPWVGQILRTLGHQCGPDPVRLVRGSHIVTRRLFDHDRCYFFQGQDGRIIFAIPYEQEFTLIGTTDQDHAGPPSDARCTEAERDYLLAFAAEYFARPLAPSDVVWSYSGVRPLYADGATSATAATRDYVLRLDRSGGAPLLNVFGGKITTYRRLAESALAKLAPIFPGLGEGWTAGVPLPGGDFAHDGAPALVARLCATYPWIAQTHAERLIRHYGTDSFAILGEAGRVDDLGRHFGATLTEAEVRWQMQHEWAKVADDVVWRRTRLGLRMAPAQVAALDLWMRSG